ncbi:flagellar basal body-associated FliL family protein [Oleiagrimonas sp. C23AA]|uniref:flagellar basal body-associated FliL family protein n=1 Tax=Oleiagrimonas sp. C23AA TaxID=2719047 RepID=UPI001422077C|nr:flagellar basal body-associated FliL family protein [Oleiagrimonas sp. C23AA]NII09188.1 flagellar basal body protein FliL [Oleiagrimonas sp. C23AA]
MAEQEAPAAKPKSKKLLIIIIVLLVLLLAGGGAAFFMMSKKAPTGANGQAAAAEHAKPKVDVKLAEHAEYLPLDPVFVVNFQDPNSSQRYLQVGVTLMSHDTAAIEAAKSAMPVIRNALLLLFSGQKSQDLASPDGKRKLQGEALKAVQGVLKDQIGRPGIEALYFTSFVMQ